jgi:hypothetical protein
LKTSVRQRTGGSNPSSSASNNEKPHLWGFFYVHRGVKEIISGISPMYLKKTRSVFII